MQYLYMFALFPNGTNGIAFLITYACYLPDLGTTAQHVMRYGWEGDSADLRKSIATKGGFYSCGNLSTNTPNMQGVNVWERLQALCKGGKGRARIPFDQVRVYNTI